MSNLITIVGEIKWVTYQVDDNKLKVAKFRQYGNNNWFNIVGNFVIKLEDGMELTLTGKYVTHEKHGYQFDVSDYDIGNTLVKPEKPVKETGRKQYNLFDSTELFNARCYNAGERL